MALTNKHGVIIPIWRVFGVVVYWGATTTSVDVSAIVGTGWGTWPPLLWGFSRLTHCLSVLDGLLAIGTPPSVAWCTGARSVPSLCS